MKEPFSSKTIILGVIVVPLVLWWVAERFGVFQGERITSGEVIRSEEDQEGESPERKGKEFELAVIAENLEVPWSAVFTSPTRLLVTERPGRVRIIENGTLRPEPLHTFNAVSSRSEEGLMGMALDPNYEENKNIFFAYAYQAGQKMAVRVVRLKDEGSRLTEEQTVIDNIPAAQYHAGTRIAFGPDQKLYITTGDATDKNIAQSLNSLGGKVLRLNGDGTIPEDNPFPGKAIFSYGHRNSQGLAWDTRTGELYATEHGPSVFDGPAGGDEVNHIMPGANYGWPLVSHKEKYQDTEEPILLFTPAIAPAGLLFYTGEELPQFTNSLLFAGLKGEGLYQALLEENDPDKVESYQKIKNVEVGRIRDVFQGPQGELYIMTSNRDGRGKGGAGDDKIFRLQPTE